MTKDEFVSHLAGITGLTKKQCDAVLDAQATVVQEVLEVGGDVTIPDICKVSVTLKAARTGRNPRTGVALTIAEHKAPKFKALKALKDAVH